MPPHCACAHSINDHDIAGCEICGCAVGYPTLAREAKESSMDDGNGCDVQPTHQTYPYHKDGSICPDWNECDTMEHYSAQGLTELGVAAQPVKPVHTNPAARGCVECRHTAAEHDRDPDGGGCMFCHCTRYNDMDMPSTNGEQRDGNVGELIDGRVDVYGDPAVVFTRHAQIWSGILGHEVQPWQVALCMMGYKLGRTAITPDYSDNSDDIEGYLDIFRTLLGEDMIVARDTAAYIAGGGKGVRA